MDVQVRQLFVFIAIFMTIFSGPGWVTASSGKCPLVMAKTPFDSNKFQGVWHVIVSSPDSVRLKGVCGKYLLEESKFGKDFLYSSIFEGRNSEGEAIRLNITSQSVVSDRTAMEYVVFHQPSLSGVFKRAVVATDYSTFATTIACAPKYESSSGTFSRMMFAEIWGREPTLSSDLIRALTSILASYGIDPADLQPARAC